jgi:AcrR family transcriptional regulator
VKAEAMVDEGGSRARIVDALLRIMASQGADALTIRTVASEAGVSVGAVQHHFATKDRLLVAAMTEVNERFRVRVAKRLEALTSDEERLRVFCREIACIEGSDLTDGIVWVAFAARASTDTDIRAIHAEDWARTEDVLLRLLGAAFPDAALTADDAALLLAVLDGIAVARAAEQSDRMTPARAERLIETTLRRVGRAG